MEPVRVTGEVVRGLQQGRTLGYPTINISYTGALDARPGVYAACVRVPEGGEFVGAAVVGGDFIVSSSPKLEVHLLDDTKIERYNEVVTVELLGFVSDLVRIADLDILKEKIAADVAAVRKLF